MFLLTCCGLLFPKMLSKNFLLRVLGGPLQASKGFCRKSKKSNGLAHIVEFSQGSINSLKEFPQQFRKFWKQWTGAHSRRLWIFLQDCIYRDIEKTQNHTMLPTNSKLEPVLPMFHAHISPTFNPWFRMGPFFCFRRLRWFGPWRGHSPGIYSIRGWFRGANLCNCGNWDLGACGVFFVGGGGGVVNKMPPRQGREPLENNTQQRQLRRGILMRHHGYPRIETWRFAREGRKWSWSWPGRRLFGLMGIPIVRPFPPIHQYPLSTLFLNTAFIWTFLMLKPPACGQSRRLGWIFEPPRGQKISF